MALHEGVHEITAEAYHADPCPEPSLSSSIVKVLAEDTPQHAWFKHPRLNPNCEREEEDKFDIGNAAHSLMLNDPKKFAIFSYGDWKKKEAQEARDLARAQGKIPLLEKHWERVNRMVELGRMQLDLHQDAAGAFTGGKAEQTLIWSEVVDGFKVWFRIRPDYIKPDYPFFDDYKTTTCAHPDTWSRVVFGGDVAHDIQAAFYRRGFRNVFKIRQPKIRFIVQEVKEPHALCVIDLSAEAYELADRRIEQSIRKWVWCRKRGKWPGYPAQTCTISPPSYRQTQLMEREEKEAERAPGADLLAAAIEFNRPL